MKYISDETRRAQHRGTGTGANYKAWIKPRELPSLGTCRSLTDWKTGRIVELLSQGEVEWYYHLRWDDTVADINEQYPLDQAITLQIAAEMGIKHPQWAKKPVVMTTDFLVTRTNGRQEAYSVKPDQNLNSRTVEKEILQQKYWESKGIPFFTVTKNSLNPREHINIEAVVQFYDKKWVRKDNMFDLIKYLIAHKQIVVDMNSEFIDYRAIAENYVAKLKGDGRL